MIEFTSTKVVDSKAYPGVSFVIKVMTEGVRTRLMLGLIDELEQIRKVQAELEAVELPRTEDGKLDESAEIDPAIMARVIALTDKINLIRKNTVDPVYGRTCFVSINGVKVDGKENPTFDDIRDRAPEKLAKEIVTAIRNEVEMTDKDKENLESPTTSGVQVAEAANDTIAPTAEKADSTSTATVTSSQI